MDKNWDVWVECRDCGTMFNIASCNWSIDTTSSNVRMIAVAVPQQCPECHNLKLVQEPDPAS